MIWIEGTPNPFGLREPSRAWLDTIEAYDTELRIFPSQKDRVYRLARVARHSGGMTGKMFRKLPGLHPDTRTMLNLGLIAVTTIPPPAVDAPPHLIVAQLRSRDLWRVQGGDLDKIADMLDQRDVDREDAADKKNQEGLRVRSRAMYTSYLYRTGARVSLLRGGNGAPVAPAEHPATPGASTDA